MPQHHSDGPFVIIIENNTGAKWPRFYVEDDGENERPVRFPTAEAARAEARGRMWENTLVWWIVELASDGEVRFGTDV